MTVNEIRIACWCFISGNIISYKGQYYYRACDAFVADNPEGGQAYCVKRVDHPGTIHEAYDGRTKGDKSAKWINKTDLFINPDEEDPDKRYIFRQVGWLGQTGRFYELTEDPSKTERGGFSPVYIQRDT